jgi:hypothetical protein
MNRSKDGRLLQQHWLLDLHITEICNILLRKSWECKDIRGWGCLTAGRGSGRETAGLWPWSQRRHVEGTDSGADFVTISSGTDSSVSFSCFRATSKREWHQLSSSSFAAHFFRSQGDLWIQCMSCELWSHSEFVGCEKEEYICHFCR